MSSESVLTSATADEYIGLVEANLACCAQHVRRLEEEQHRLTPEARKHLQSLGRSIAMLSDDALLGLFRDLLRAHIRPAGEGVVSDGR